MGSLPPPPESPRTSPNAGGYLLNQERRVQPSHQMLNGVELMFVPHGKRLGQFDFGVHDMAP